jgi:N-acetyl-anhydromuramoyl-L-alanine amidase
MSDAVIDGGWWPAATRIDSPNFDGRPVDARVELIVLHHISLPAGDFSTDTVIDFFQNRIDTAANPELAEIADIRVSAHFFVRRNGHVIQFVSTHDRAWHAGVSAWCGRTGCNDFSVGIEIEGTSDVAFEDAQYNALNALIAALLGAYPDAALTSHSEIAPGRKVDPGPMFDWARLQRRSSI